MPLQLGGITDLQVLLGTAAVFWLLAYLILSTLCGFPPVKL